MLTLYQVPLSGHSHRAKLFLSLLDLDHVTVEIDFMGEEHKSAAHLARNAFGEVPVLEDDGVPIADSNAILVYLARRYGDPHWLPRAPVVEAEVQRWLSVAAGRIAYGPCAARLNTLFGANFNVGEVTDRAHQTLRVMDAVLTDRQWIAGTDAPTIADVALYSYVERAPEGNIDIAPYVAVRRWLAGVEGLNGFVPMPRSPVGLESGEGPRAAAEFRVTGYEHVGIRVTDRDAATAFYEALGWREVVDIPGHRANEMTNDAGVRINLIFNGEEALPDGFNILQDDARKHPGLTHAAFVVDTLAGLMAALAAHKIAITEGPVAFDDRRTAIFIRDPDGNVLEFNAMGGA